MDVLVVGATRGTGRAITEELAARGHTVTAFGRTASAVYTSPEHDRPEHDRPEHDRPGHDRTGHDAPERFGRVRPVDGDVLDPDAVRKAVAGQDAVVVALGISDNPLAVQWLRRASTALDVRSRGTAVIVEAMRQEGVRRLVVQSTFGLGDSWQSLNLQWKLTFRLVIGRQFTDSAQQEALVRDSGLDWTLIRPVALTDDQATAAARVTTDDTVAGMTVARSQVARVHADAVADPAAAGAILSVSAA
jgi:nucleoside-diphosphate-sugar epimerase